MKKLFLLLFFISTATFVFGDSKCFECSLENIKKDNILDKNISSSLVIKKGLEADAISREVRDWIKHIKHVTIQGTQRTFSNNEESVGFVKVSINRKTFSARYSFEGRKNTNDNYELRKGKDSIILHDKNTKQKTHIDRSHGGIEDILLTEDKNIDKLNFKIGFCNDKVMAFISGENNDKFALVFKRDIQSDKKPDEKINDDESEQANRTNSEERKIKDSILENKNVSLSLVRISTSWEDTCSNIEVEAFDDQEKDKENKEKPILDKKLQDE